MGTNDSGSNMRFQHRIDERILNCPSSGMDTNPLSDKVAGMAMGSGSMFKSSSGGGGGGAAAAAAAADTFFGSGWDPLLSLTQNENFGGSSVVPHPHSEFANSSYSVVMENQVLPCSSHLVHFPPDSILVEMVPKLPCFGSGSFSEMVGSFGLPDSAQIATPGYNEDGSEKASSSQGDQQISEEGTMGISPCGKRKKRASESNSPLNPNKTGEEGEEQQRDISGDEKKQKIEQNMSANSRGKQSAKQAKDSSNSGEAPKEAYIHVRARRGQATNSHSLAERVRRERISERMRLLQELVPGCNKITGKAVMLDEIINYVQSLQQQVEFLSMKLATVNPELNIDIDRLLSKEILHSRGGGSALPGFGPGMSSSHPYPSGIPQGALPPGIPSASAFHPLPQNVWDNELHSLLQMGFDPNSAISNLGPTGRSKLDL